MLGLLRKTLLLTAALLATGLFVGCAQDVGDIDRTQPNFIKKTDLEGVWYYRQTVTDVPPTMAYAFVGWASDMEKIRFEIQENFLVAYRMYEKYPGQDNKAGDIVDGEQQFEPGWEDGRNSEDYKEAPVAAFAISHFDRQRAYNPSTGEQQNVIVENFTDRAWYEREYIRVDWSFNFINSLYFINGFQAIADIGYYVQENEGGPDALYAEDIEGNRISLDVRKGDAQIGYFDFVNKMSLTPSRFSCYYYGSDCETGLIKVRNSFMKLPEIERDYEPVFYDDNAMTKFGYFRTDRRTYDRLRGYTDSGRIFLANRHDIWEDDFQRDANGEYVRDNEGRRVLTPMAQRTPKPIVYYLSENYPEELMPGATAMAEDWDRAFKRSVAAVKNTTIDSVPQMYVLCHNPVRDGDHDACGPTGTVARIGDLRKSFVYWVDTPQAAGPLGYGPSYPDPETGELISGTAYVYGASVDTYARSSLEIIRFLNGDFTEDEIKNGDDVRQWILANLNPAIDPRGVMNSDSMAKLAQIPAEQAGINLLDPKKIERIEMIRENGLEPLAGDPLKKDRAIQRMKEYGFDRLLLDDEAILGLSNGRITPADFANLDRDSVDQFLQDSNPLDLHKFQKQHREFIDEAARNNVYLAEFADDAVMATAARFKGRTDYDNIWNEIRNEIFRGVMAHEVGHTIGLRHNFNGSFDTVNFFDEYWDLRKENLMQPSSVADFYTLNQLTPAQIEGDMTSLQYSSIMDYHSRFSGDWQGIGKYDEAAVIFAYTSGTYEPSTDCVNRGTYGSEGGAGCQELGYVEVFTSLPNDAAELVRAFDNRLSPAYSQMAENVHYTSIVTTFGEGNVDAGIENMRSRALQRFSTIADNIDDPTRSPMVPYMFCSDEWVGAAFSCHRWDLGADPMEQVQWSIRNYRAYYPFTHYRRDRLNFSINSVLSRAFRNFAIMPNIYQHWYYNQFYGSFDQTLDNYFLFGALTGLNFLAEVMTAPSYGAYRYDSQDDQYYLISYDPEYTSDQGPVDLRIYPGAGRRNFSRYLFDTGYYYFTRVAEVGNYWDFRAALESLTASNYAVLGVDVNADFRSFSLPYYLAFEDELTTLFNGLVMQNYEDFAPTATATGMLKKPLTVFTDGQNTFDPETGNVFTEQGSPINVRSSFAQRLYAELFGMATFTSSYSLHYVDQGRVFKVGNGEQVTPGPGSELIQFTDPATNISYGALVPQGGTTNPGLGEQMVRKGMALVAQANGGDRNAQFELQQLVENINITIDMVDAFGGVLF